MVVKLFLIITTLAFVSLNAYAKASERKLRSRDPNLDNPTRAANNGPSLGKLPVKSLISKLDEKPKPATTQAALNFAGMRGQSLVPGVTGEQPFMAPLIDGGQSKDNKNDPNKDIPVDPYTES